MHFRVVQRILGLLLMLYSITMMPPVAVSVHFADGQTGAFFNSFVITFVVGLLTWLPARNDRRELRLRDGFIVAAIFWLGLGSFGALPLLLTHFPEMSLTDAVFEAVSGLTTTGATALTGLDSLPPSILYYRAQLHWLGGMGIIVLAVAILPMLGVGGMQLYRAETPGPMKDSKLTPRITETAKALWLIYVGLTAACGLAYWYAGMSAFDAVCHSFATLATGGFSTHDASIGYFHSPLIELIAVVFMFLAGANFTLHFVAWRSRGLRGYWSDPEFRAYTLILCSLTLAGTIYLVFTQQYASVGDSARYSLFHFVSFMTSTGFVASNFDQWPGALPLSLILVSFIGGCAGSTGGGMKVVRWLLLFNQGSREVQRLVHPAAEIPIRLGRSVVSPRVIEAVWGFCVVYIILFGAMLLVLVSTGLDQITAFSALATSINNMGPGLGRAVADFTHIGAAAKWVCIFAMLLGRLEVFTLLVLFSPSFWRS
ncbi:MAG: TrkH family potassium uptake protein [Gammaproteobacteria bacterium]